MIDGQSHRMMFMIRVPARLFLLVLLFGASASAQRAPIPRQLVFTPYHANGIYNVGETVL